MGTRQTARLQARPHQADRIGKGHRRASTEYPDAEHGERAGLSAASIVVLDTSVAQHAAHHEIDAGIWNYADDAGDTASVKGAGAFRLKGLRKTVRHTTVHAQGRHAQSCLDGFERVNHDLADRTSKPSRDEPLRTRYQIWVAAHHAFGCIEHKHLDGRFGHDFQAIDPVSAKEALDAFLRQATRCDWMFNRKPKQSETSR